MRTVLIGLCHRSPSRIQRCRSSKAPIRRPLSVSAGARRVDLLGATGAASGTSTKTRNPR